MQLVQWQTKVVGMHSNSWFVMERCNGKEVENADLPPGSFCIQHLDGSGEIFQQESKNGDYLRPVNNTGNYSQLSTSSTMSRNFTPTFVYQRKRQINNSVPNFKIEPPNGIKPSNGAQSAISSEIPSLTAQQNIVSISEPAAEFGPVERDTVAAIFVGKADRVLNIVNANDNCSSSKSNLELSWGSLKFDTDECSSSGALIDEKELSTRDLCISILRRQGLLNNVRTTKNRARTENSEKYRSKPCRVCARTESTSNMLVCDNCEDGFHVSCYNPLITVLPVGEWLCGSCLKKKHKILKDKSAGNSNSICNEIGELGSLEFMFRDTEPYMSNVRIGDDFQANVPDWSGPIDEECNRNGDPFDMDPSGYVNIQERDSVKTVKLSSIGNWLQCRGVMEGIGDETICAKWRRAPLFEVQTDNFECFRCVLWDPAHADCAVPQEIDTEEVVKQLKYIEMLRPRLAAKRRKMDS